MKASRVVRALGPIDAKQTARDPLMRWLVFYPLLMGLVVRWGTPPVGAYLQARFQWDLAPHYPLLMAFLVVSIPAMAGTVIGFLLLDQRDDRTLEALLVTPLPATVYVAYRISLPMAISALVTLVVCPVAGLLKAGFWTVLASAIGAAPLAAAYAIGLASFAANKVQGFALAKGLGVLMIPPAAAWFLSPPWHWLMGVSPLFWPAKTLWMLERGDPDWWIVWLAGLVLQGALLTALLRRYRRVVSRPD